MTSAFRNVPLTGVIYVSSEAERRGFSLASKDWCNLGQGQPETGLLPGSPARLTQIAISAEGQEYAPVGGIKPLREAVAAFYNRRFRQGMKSQYTADNVAISAGGRLAVTRAAAALGPVNLGHFLPDYTAYEELLDVFHVFSPIPMLLRAEQHYQFSLDKLEEEVLGRGLSALLFSNPSNPTGTVLQGDRLKDWLKVSKQLDLALIIDEFYSHYIWTPAAKIVSAAAYVEDVEEEAVLVIDGLTKNWRYPGLRLSWTLGPKSVIEAIKSAGSFLDGGASRPTQEAAIELLDDSYVDAESRAIHNVFKAKRDFLLRELMAMGITVESPPEGGFYIWGKLDQLPSHLQGDMNFFQAALEHKVIVVPGRFFDINPGKKRHPRPSRFENHIRFSFGPSMAVLEESCRRLRHMMVSPPPLKKGD
ncbi:MAG: pyridoxal phosphate-dependent aminotransferase [Myxococcota bacterium]